MHHGRLRTPVARALRNTLVAGATLGLAACGGGASSGSGTGSFSLSITDGPVTEADNVWVQFSSVTLKPVDGEPIELAIDDPGDAGDAGFQRVDLLTLQGEASMPLVIDEPVAAGDYEWIRLGVDLGPGQTVIVIGGQEHDLEIPSGAQTGLKVQSDFAVAAGGELSLTIDFELSKSVIEAPPGEFKLKPVLRLVNDEETGSISATATSNYIVNTAGCGDADDQAVYVYAGEGVTPDDIDMSDDGDVDPLTRVALTDADVDGVYTATAADLPAGEYTVAFSCEPELDTAEADEPIDFLAVRDVEVEAGETTLYELP